MSETLHLEQRFELEKHLQETERTFVTTDPEFFEQYRPFAEQSIQQVYLSNPNDEYSLRMRETTTDSGVNYSAALKDRGELVADGLSRLEVEIPISKETYDYHCESRKSIIHQLRAEPVPGFTIDWVDGCATPVIEIEDASINEEASFLLSTLQDRLVEVTGDRRFDKEALAYSLNGLEFEPAPDLNIETVLGDVEAYKRMGKKNIVLTLAGRSGSGKTTFTREVAQALADTYGSAPIVVSTDDYHFGKTYLESTYKQEWTNWDLGEVYNTAELAKDIERLHRHEPVQSRAFDFKTQEPVRGNKHIFNPIIIVEGIHAGSRDLATVRDIHFQIPTTFATSMGRDIARLLHRDRPNDSIGTPEDRLQYMLGIGEPTYQTFERPRRNRFSGSVRSLGAAALK